MSGTVTWEILLFFGSVIAASMGVAGWQFRIISSLRKEIADHKLYAANHYATKEGVNKELDKISDTLDRIMDRLDRVLEK